MGAFKSGKQLNIKSIIFYAICAIVCVASCVVLSCLNVYDSVALEQEIRCGIAAHTHTDSCYDEEILVCEETAHTHDGNCYIVLLKENDINGILSLLSSDNASLEGIITDTMSTALNFNTNINNSDKDNEIALNCDSVSELNDAISKQEELPDIVLNENINNLNTIELEDQEQEKEQEQTQTQNAQTEENIPLYLNGATTYSIGDQPVTSNYNANFYIYLDGEWTCIGSLQFSTARSGWAYNSTIATSEVLTLVNTTLGTNYNYNSFDISVSNTLNGTYSKSNIGMGANTTTIGYQQSNNNSRAAKYVRLIPNNALASSTALAFYTVTYEYPDGITSSSSIIEKGTTITLPQGNYEWSSGDNTYASGETFFTTLIFQLGAGLLFQPNRQLQTLLQQR